MKGINGGEQLNDLSVMTASWQGGFGGSSRGIKFILHLLVFFKQHSSLCFMILNELVKN